MSALFASLSENLLVAPQLSQQDIANAAIDGIQTIICNRPDREEPNQPDIDQIRQWAAEAGIPCVLYQPVQMPQIDSNAARKFARQIQQSPAPVLAYCRSGVRSSLLWALGQLADGAEPHQLVQTAAKAGIDISAALPRLLAAQGEDFFR